MLRLQPQVAHLHRDAIQWQRPVQHLVPLQNVRVLQREDVGRSQPLGDSERQRRWIFRFLPGTRGLRERAQRGERQRFYDHEDVLIRALHLLVARRGPIQHDRPQRAVMHLLELRDQIVQPHRVRHRIPE